MSDDRKRDEESRRDSGYGTDFGDDFGTVSFGDTNTDEQPTISFGKSDTGPLPHWSEPPTGELPRFIDDAPSGETDVWSSFAADDTTRSQTRPVDTRSSDSRPVRRDITSEGSLFGDTGASSSVFDDEAVDISGGMSAQRERISIGGDYTDERRRPVHRAGASPLERPLAAPGRGGHRPRPAEPPAHGGGGPRPAIGQAGHHHLRPAAKRRGRLPGARQPAHRSHPPDQGAHGPHRPPVGGRRVVWWRAGGGSATPGPARRPAGLRPPGDGAGHGLPRAAAAGSGAGLGGVGAALQCPARAPSPGVILRYRGSRRVGRPFSAGSPGSPEALRGR